MKPDQFVIARRGNSICSTLFRQALRLWCNVRDIVSLSRFCLLFDVFTASIAVVLTKRPSSSMLEAFSIAYVMHTSLHLKCYCLRRGVHQALLSIACGLLALGSRCATSSHCAFAITLSAFVYCICGWVAQRY